MQFNCGNRTASRAASLPGWCKNDTVQTWFLTLTAAVNSKPKQQFESWKTNTVSARCGPQSQTGPASWVQPGVLGTKGHGLQCLLGSSFPGNQPSPYPTLQRAGTGPRQKGAPASSLCMVSLELSQKSSPHGLSHFRGFWNESTLGVFPSNAINMRI